MDVSVKQKIDRGLSVIKYRSHELTTKKRGKTLKPFVIR